MKTRRYGPRPGEFALGSLRSRAAARLQERAAAYQSEQSKETWLRSLTPFQRAHVTEPSNPTIRELEVFEADHALAYWRNFGLPYIEPQQLAKHQPLVNRLVHELQMERRRKGQEPLGEQALRRMAEDMLEHPQ